MRRDVVELWSPELGWSPRVVVHGSYGRPVIVFPSSEGRPEDYEGNGMVEAVRPLIEQGRLHPEDVFTHRMGLSEAADAYRTFDTRADGCLKVLLDPTS